MNLYGAEWPNDAEELDIEFACIRKGGRWLDEEGFLCGKGLYHHHRRVWSLLWPDDDHHRWIDLALRRICENDITVFMGPGDSAKTHAISKFVMGDYWAAPEHTLWMASTTDKRGAELRIWGKIKEFFNRGKERYPDLLGKIIESKGWITPDEISEDGEKARLLTRGIVLIPCKQGNTWIGLGPYAGIKPPTNGRMGHAGDECSLMHPTFLDAYANWYGKQNFRGLLTGNPGDLEDPLCTAGEPEGGWESWEDSGKTQEWRSKWYNAWVVAFDGRDTPNNDYPYVDGKPKFHYLIGKKKLDAVKAHYGENDWHWWNQCIGKPQTSVQSRRVVTRAQCEQYHAFEDVLWGGLEEVTKVVSLDAAYGGLGGDRCILTEAHFGKDVSGHSIFAPHGQPVPVPVSVRNPEPPETQITQFCKMYCAIRGIPPRHFFFDGRGTLAIIMAREWSAEVNCVDFGGAPTDRPVSNDAFIWEGDKNTRRLRKCNEEYFNFVTELWFAAYQAVISGQMRRLSRDVAREGYQRTWNMKGTRKQVEPKDEMKERTKQSPDLFDGLVTALEGARRLGFTIEKLREPGTPDEDREEDWLEMELAKRRAFLKKSSLSYAT